MQARKADREYWIAVAKEWFILELPEALIYRILIRAYSGVPIGHNEFLDQS